MEKTKLQIHTWPEKILRKKCRVVRKVDDNIRSLLDEMYALMKVSDGVGLAVNQAGLDLKLFVIEAEDKTYKLVNPKIIQRHGEITFREGCLSFPGLELDIKRANKIKVAALNEKGELIDIDATGVLAVVFQHEIDHVNGTVFIDKVSFWKRLRIIPQLKKIAKLTKQRQG